MSRQQSAACHQWQSPLVVSACVGAPARTMSVLRVDDKTNEAGVLYSSKTRHGRYSTFSAIVRCGQSVPTAAEAKVIDESLMPSLWQQAEPQERSRCKMRQGRAANLQPADLKDISRTNACPALTVCSRFERSCGNSFGQTDIHGLWDKRAMSSTLIDGQPVAQPCDRCFGLRLRNRKADPDEAVAIDRVEIQAWCESNACLLKYFFAE